MEQQTGSESGKEYIKTEYCHPAYLTYMQSTSYEMLGWTKPKLARLQGENSNNLRYADDTTFTSEREEELNSLLIKVKEESEEADLKLNIQELKVMASSHIISWQIDGEKMETVTDSLFLGSKITVDCDGSHEIKRRLLHGSKAMTNLDNILKSRDIILLTKVYLSKQWFFQQSCTE